MPTFKFHGNLREHIPNGEIFLSGSLSLRESLHVITDLHQSLNQVLFVPGTEEIREPYILVVNGELVRFFEEELDIILKTDDIVQFFPPISGG